MSFLAGYVDAEGHIGIHSGNGTPFLKIATQDKKIINSIQKKLIKFSIGCPPANIRTRAGYITPSDPSKKTNKDIWEVGIYMPGILRLLHILTPFLKHPKRKSDALKVLNYIIDGYYGRRKVKMDEMEQSNI